MIDTAPNPVTAIVVEAGDALLAAESAVRTTRPTISDEDAAILDRLKDLEGSAMWRTAAFLRRRETQITRTLGPEAWRELRGQYANQRGILPSTLRELINTDRRVGRYRRVPQYESLSFSHFKYAARAENPLALLDRVVASADDYGGQPAPVSVLREWLKEEGTTSPQDTDHKLLNQARSVLVSLRERTKSKLRRSVLQNMIDVIDRWLNEE